MLRDLKRSPDWAGGGNTPDNVVGAGPETLQKTITTSDQTDDNTNLDPSGGNAPASTNAPSN